MLETLDWGHFDLAQTCSDVELGDFVLAFPDLFHLARVLVYPDLYHLVLTHSEWCHSDLVLTNLILAEDLVGDCPNLVYDSCYQNHSEQIQMYLKMILLGECLEMEPD